jgi:hypothetical protein
MRVWSCDQARQALERAVQLDPSYPLAHSELARALECLGHDDVARVEAKKALEQSANLPEHVRLLTESRYYIIATAWEDDLPVQQRLSQLFPENIVYGMDLARAQWMVGRREDAHATIES